MKANSLPSKPLASFDGTHSDVREWSGESSRFGYKSFDKTPLKSDSNTMVIHELPKSLFSHMNFGDLRISQIAVSLDETIDDPAKPPNFFVRLTRRLHKFDLFLSTPIHKLSLGNAGDWLIVFWAQIFSVWFVPFTFTFTCFFLNTEYGMTLLLAGTLTPILNSTLKGVFLRWRPDPETIGSRRINLRRALKNHSFPSGDSAEAGCWGACVAIATNSKWPLLATPLTMFARVYYGAHYVGDTIVGAALGASVAILVSSKNNVIVNNLEGEENWFPIVLGFAMIPALALCLYYFYLCAKGLR